MTFRIKKPRSRKRRFCPECRSEITIGDKYARYAGINNDGDFYHGFSCLPCNEMIGIYREHALLVGGEFTYTPGEAISEVEDYMECYTPRYTPKGDRRDKLIRVLKRSLENMKAQIAEVNRRVIEKRLRIRIAQGMTQHSALKVTPQDAVIKK